MNTPNKLEPVLIELAKKAFQEGYQKGYRHGQNGRMMDVSDAWAVSEIARRLEQKPSKAETEASQS